MKEQQITTQVPDTQLANTEVTETLQEKAVGTNDTSKEEVVTEATTEASNKTTDVASENVDNNVQEVDELKKRLKEYELREEESKNLSERLGVPKDVSPELMQAEQQLLMVNNQAQQAYISLCNEYGVDYRPEKIEASANELANKDPKKYYDLLYKLNQLDTAVSAKRQEVDNFVRAKQYEQAVAKYNQALQASPAMASALNAYLGGQQGDPRVLTEQFMNLVVPMYQEAITYGKLLAEQQAVNNQANPAEILNNNTMTSNSSYATTGPKIYTIAEIEKMDDATFAKNEAEITRQYRAGLIK